jgi:F-type H+-transporting ATPase subunit gamma
MAGIKELQQRITSVGNIKQITRAMEMVATTKLRRFQDRALCSRPYAEEIGGLVARLSAVLGDAVAERPLFNPGAGERTLALVVASDRGLCGAYNSSLFRTVEAWRAQHELEVDYLVYGRKGFAYMDRRDFQIERFLEDPPLEQIDYANASITARMLVSEFESGKYRDVRLFYTAFESMMKFRPCNVPFLPIAADAFESEGAVASGETLLEPDAAAIFDHLIPKYLETRIFNALLEALTSEYASRRFAMKNATDAANDMQSELRGIYNRRRQEKITKELLDIVGGAEAVK